MASSLRMASPSTPDERWASNVVLGNGETVHIRPIRPDGRAGPGRVPPPPVAREHLPPLLLAQAGADRRPSSMHFTNIDMVDRVALVVERYGEFDRLGQLRALGRPRRRRRRVHGRRRPPRQGHRHAAARAPGGDRPSQRHRALHGRGAGRQPPDAGRVQPRRLAGRTALRERRRRPRLLARRDRGVPRLGRAPRAAGRLPGHGPPAAAPDDRRRRGQRPPGLGRRGAVAARHVGSATGAVFPVNPQPRHRRRRAGLADRCGRPGRRLAGRGRRARRRSWRRSSRTASSRACGVP